MVVLNDNYIYGYVPIDICAKRAGLRQMESNQSGAKAGNESGISEGAMAIIKSPEIRGLLREKGEKIELLNSIIEDALNSLMDQIFGAKQLFGEGESAFSWMPPEEYVPLPGTEGLVELAISMNMKAYGEIRCTPLLKIKRA